MICLFKILCFQFPESIIWFWASNGSQKPERKKWKKEMKEQVEMWNANVRQQKDSSPTHTLPSWLQNWESTIMSQTQTHWFWFFDPATHQKSELRAASIHGPNDSKWTSINHCPFPLPILHCFSFCISLGMMTWYDIIQLPSPAPLSATASALSVAASMASRRSAGYGSWVPRLVISSRS